MCHRSIKEINSSFAVLLLPDLSRNLCMCDVMLVSGQLVWSVGDLWSMDSDHLVARGHCSVGGLWIVISW